MELSMWRGVGAAAQWSEAVLRRIYCMVLTCFALAAPAPAREAFSGWVPYVNERFGFSFHYPAGVFEPERRSEAGDGEVFVGVRGDGRLLVGAFENAHGHSVSSYMNDIRRESYSGYGVDYSPR